MSKKTKSKSISKGKAKKSVSSSKKIQKKKVKPAAKKAVSKPAKKAKSKAAAKPVKKSKAAPAKKTVAKKSVARKATPAKAPASKAKSQPAKTATAKVVEKQQETPKNITQQNRPSVGRPMPVNRRPEPARAIISNSKPEKESGKNRYSDSELEEFRDIINKKLEEARKELATLQAQMTAANDNGTDDTASTFKILEDGSDSLAKEEAGQLASRQKKFIEQLENALVRIENKTYGICRVTGKLIPKERLRAVPHTTQSIEAKLNQYRD